MADVEWMATPKPVFIDLGENDKLRVNRSHGKFSDGRESNTIALEKAFGRGKITLPGEITDDTLKELVNAIRHVSKPA